MATEHRLKSRTLPDLGRKTWATLVPDDIWAPLTGALLIFLVGVIGLAARRPWLFASLGPTAYLHAENPEHRSSHFYNTVVGHGVALGAGFLAVWILNAWSAPNVMATGHLTGVRVLACTSRSVSRFSSFSRSMPPINQPARPLCLSRSVHSRPCTMLSSSSLACS